MWTCDHYTEWEKWMRGELSDDDCSPSIVGLSVIESPFAGQPGSIVPSFLEECFDPIQIAEWELRTHFVSKRLEQRFPDE